jgi:hypothetical protein
MKAIEFKEQNKVFAKDQPRYSPLPAFDDGNQVIFCQSLSLKERVRVLFTGKIWVSLLMFGALLTPSFHTTKKSDLLA